MEKFWRDKTLANGLILAHGLPWQIITLTNANTRQMLAALSGEPEAAL